MPTQQNLAQVSIGKEAVAFKTEAAAYQPFPGLQERGDAQPTVKENEIPINEFGTRHEADQSLHGESDHSWKTKMRLQNAKPLFWVMGASVDGGTGPDSFTHAITNSNEIKSFSIEHIINEGGANEYSHKFLGCKCDELTLTMTKGAPVICEVTFQCASHTINTTPAASQTILTDVPYEFHQATTLTVNGVAYHLTTRQLTLTVGNGLEKDRNIADRDPFAITEGTRKAMITLEIFELDETLTDLLKNRTDFALSIVLTRASGPHTITITIANAKVFEPSYDFGGNSVVDIIPIRIIGDFIVDVVDNQDIYDE